MTRWLIYHAAGGGAFFNGAGCLVAAALVSWFAKRRGVRAGRNLLVVIGVVAAAASATPLRAWVYGVLAMATCAWLGAEAMGSRAPGRLVVGLRIVVILAWSAVVMGEVPFHQTPRLAPMGEPTLGIIGDSITAGMGGDDEDEIWPKVLADSRGIEVRSHARMGATVASALRQAEELSADERLVLLEIGGNDLLGGTAPQDFKAGLDRLLTAVARPGRVVVMLELPLPPTYNAFGLAQRRLARRHRVLLVPKRVLLGVLQHECATVDSIHLSAEGHRRMAEAMWAILRPAYGE